MDHEDIRQRFAALTTAHLADACIRAQTPVRCGPALLHAVVPGIRLAGRVIPARHAAASTSADDDGQSAVEGIHRPQRSRLRKGTVGIQRERVGDRTIADPYRAGVAPTSAWLGPRLPDPADRKFAALADAVQAPLVTSDAGLLNAGGQMAVPVLKPSEFARRCGALNRESGLH